VTCIIDFVNLTDLASAVAGTYERLVSISVGGDPRYSSRVSKHSSDVA
jgi:hypothetical protein